MRIAIALSLVTLAWVMTAASSALAGIPVASTSSIWLDPDTTTVGDTVDVYVIIRDLYGEPIPDLSCDFLSDKGDTDIVIGSPDVTDLDGLAQARVTRNRNFYPNTPHVSHITVNCEGIVLGPLTVTWFCEAGVDGGRSVVTALYRNAPNPFRAMTEISYAMASGASVSLDVYDVEGKKVKSLVGGVVGPGSHSVRWDATNDAGGAAPPGVYFVRMVAPGFTRTRSLILLR